MKLCSVVSVGCLCLCLWLVGGFVWDAQGGGRPQKAVDFHRAGVVLDLHADTLYALMLRWYNISQWQRRHDVDVPKLRAGGVSAQVFVLFVQPRWMRRKGDGWRILTKMHKAFHRMLRESKGALVHARTAADILRIRKQGKIAALLAIEGLHPLEGSWKHAQELATWGLVYAGLTWNNSNPFATSASDAKRSQPWRKRGLTALGRRVVRLLEEHRVLVDLSHASKRTFWDVERMAKRPFIASHSNAQALCRHERNLDDQQLRAIARHGGVVGINFYTLFLKSGKRHRSATLKDVIAHIDHIVRIAGIEHIALGSDFDGILSKPRGLSHIGHLPRLTKALQEHGYARPALRLLLGHNVLRLMSRTLKPSKKGMMPQEVAPGTSARPQRKALTPPSTQRFQGKKQMMVATAHPHATSAALDMLNQGGTAADAAIAAAFLLAVVEPYASGLGGGGLLLTYDAAKQKVESLDFRERAPLRADAQMYVRHGKKGRWRSRRGHLAVATPGMVAGMDALWRRHGQLPWATLLAPAQRMAQRGIRVFGLLARNFARQRKKLGTFRDARRVFLNDGIPRKRGSLWKQPDLARTLARMQRWGAREFYHGKTARLIDAEMRRHKGLLSLADLQQYRARWVAPLQGSYRGHTIYTMGSPSAGGASLLQIMQILSGFPLSQMKPLGAARLHLLAEAMRLGFLDSHHYQGDARFVPVPVKAMLSPANTMRLRKLISPTRAQAAGVAPSSSADPFAKMHTSHISVIDRWGNAVSMTLTINTHFGSGVVAGGTGVILNNEMDDFTTHPGRANSYGLMQGAGNLILPGKTPLSAMAPTLLFLRNKLKGVMGSPGGPTISTTIIQMISNLLDHNMSAKAAMRSPRIHHQWRPHSLKVERKIPRATQRKLRQMGHRISRRKHWGNAMLLWVDAQGRLTGARDPRGVGDVRGD